jgi:hypothetical protein
MASGQGEKQGPPAEVLFLASLVAKPAFLGEKPQPSPYLSLDMSEAKEN